MNTNKNENLVITTQIDKSVKGKFEEWGNILVGKDIHSIRSQIYDMIFDSAAFLCINESRKYVAKNDEGHDKRNEMLHSFINQSFFKTQLLSIRRLVDKDFNRIQQNRSYTVYSLYNLIEDIKKNSALFTRGNILAIHSLPYDYEKAWEEFKNDTGYTKGFVIEPPSIACSEDIHRRIDSIVGLTPDKRNFDDRVLNKDSFKHFHDWLENSQELYDYVNKFIVHAATPESRFKALDKDEIDRALGKVLYAHKVICETASFIGNKILFCGFGEFLSGPQYGRFDQFDLFEYLDEPIASKETIEKLREFWQKYKMETEQWNQL